MAILKLVGDSQAKVFSLPIQEWQRRSWGLAGLEDADGAIVANGSWVLSANLAAAVVDTPGVALVTGDDDGLRLIASHTLNAAQTEEIAELISAGAVTVSAIEALNLKPVKATDIAQPFNRKLRKREAPWAIDTTDGVTAAERALFNSAYKGATDLVTKFVWPKPAIIATRFSARLGITPNQITTVSLIFVLLALYFFTQGQWALGITCGWLMTFLDTVDGKLARTTITSSRWGHRFDHGIDIIHPPFWYIAWVEGIRVTTETTPEWLYPALYVILAFYLIGRLIERKFRKTHGFHIHVWRQIDSVFRVITARRNPNMLIFMIFCMIDMPAEGVLAVAIWSVLSNGFHILRLFQAGLNRTTPPQVSWLGT